MSLHGRLALVTGAGRGLGLEMARALGRDGAAVLVNGRDAARLAEPVRALVAEGIEARPLAFDVTDAQAVAGALQGADPVDILVNNVGRRDRRGALHLPVEDFSRLLETDLTAAYGLSRLVAGRLVAEGRSGSVVNISSVVGGSLGNAGDAAYAAAKAGLEGLTRALAMDLGPYGIRVNAVAPGTFATEANAADFATDAWQQRIRLRSALQRFGRPHEIGGVVAFLAGDGASYITGQVIAVDGGLSVRF